MSSTKPTGGSAFPQDRVDMYGVRTSEGGMDLRDWFAGKALQGALAGILADGSTLGDGAPSIIAVQAYRFADAMLAARAEVKP